MHSKHLHLFAIFPFRFITKNNFKTIEVSETDGDNVNKNVFLAKFVVIWTRNINNDSLFFKWLNSQFIFHKYLNSVHSIGSFNWIRSQSSLNKNLFLAKILFFNKILLAYRMKKKQFDHYFNSYIIRVRFILFM